jgi:pimeloyl-ACP methyl ester carboxylesterase
MTHYIRRIRKGGGEERHAGSWLEVVEVLSKLDLSRDLRLLFVCLSLVMGVVAALAILISVSPPARAQGPVDCASKDEPQVPGAEQQDADCLTDLTTRTLTPDHTRQDDWAGLHALETENPAGTELIPGLQIDGYFPDSSTTNCYNNEDGFPCHDSQFVIRLPDEWNGKLVITGAPGVRKQYALDFIISDFVVSKDYEEEGGYAFASTDKGNSGNNFYDDGSEPGGSVAEWHRRVEELTKAAKDTAERWYGKRPDRTYMTGISNGGYLTRYAIENNPGLYDGAVDWEGVLWRPGGPNLFTHLPQALRHWNECKTSAPEYDNHACELMRRAGYPKGSEFLWEEHYLTYWDLTQRIYREEFDPRYDRDAVAEDGTPGYPFCQEEANIEGCDANYQYGKRPDRVKDAVRKVSLTGNIGKPMLTLHGTLDVLLPMRLHSNRYRALIENAGKGNRHRYYKIEDGTHVDSYFDRWRQEPTYVRPILPCYWAAFEEIEEWVEEEGSDPRRPPDNKTVPHPTPEGTPADANNCSINGEATYSPPTSTG